MLLNILVYIIISQITVTPEVTGGFLMNARHTREGTVPAIQLLSAAQGLIFKFLSIRDQMLNLIPKITFLTF